VNLAQDGSEADGSEASGRVAHVLGKGGGGRAPEGRVTTDGHPPLRGWFAIPSLSQDVACAPSWATFGRPSGTPHFRSTRYSNGPSVSFAGAGAPAIASTNPSPGATSTFDAE
jgi:hypothetical protein